MGNFIQFVATCVQKTCVQNVFFFYLLSAPWGPHATPPSSPRVGGRGGVEAKPTGLHAAGCAGHLGAVGRGYSPPEVGLAGTCKRKLARKRVF